MSSVSQIAQTLHEVLEERAKNLAKETGFIQRVRAFTGADLGFWGVARFSQMARRGQGCQKRRYFLSRLQAGVKLRRRNGSEIVLRGILPQQVGERVELGAVVGEQRLPVRVLIERVPREVGDQRRQDIRENAQDHGRTPSEEVL